jgi:Cu(I)/Ag(I) efflux system membrane protein CusA/SilA
MTYYGRKNYIVLLKIELLFCSFPLVWLGIYSVQENPIDAIPDLSENQVIVLRRMGRSPQVIEDQVTYPLVSNLVFLKSKYPGFFLMSFIYIILKIM